MEFFYVAKATQKSGKPDAVVWFTAKTEARANLQLDVYLEDAEIETGRGQDYNKPIRTDFPVYNDLPEEGEVDLTWCERYLLQEDGRTWSMKPSTKPNTSHSETSPVSETKPVDLLTYDKYPWEKKVLGTWLFGLFDSLSEEQLEEIARVELDMDETYAQNVMLAARDFKTRAMEYTLPETLAGLFMATKSIWPVAGKVPMLNDLITFFSEWIGSPHSDSKYREDATAKWFAKYNKAFTSTPSTAETKPVMRYKRSVPQNMANLKNEVAVALLYPDAVPGQVTLAQLTAAKDVVGRKEDIHVKAMKVLGKITDVMDYDSISIFGVTNAIKWSNEDSTSELCTQVRNWFTDNGIYEDGSKSKGYPEWAHKDSAQSSQPRVVKVADGIFSVEGLMASSKDNGNNNEATSNVQMEAIEHPENEDSTAVSAGKGAVEVDQQTNTVGEPVCTSCGAAGGGHCPDCGAVAGDSTYTAMEDGLKEEVDALEHDTSAPEHLQAEPVAEYPAFFEPGRYEGLPNDVYHAANGISSTQVKDARVSLMYFEARHVTKTITKERSPVLDMGNLVHALALQPELLDVEFSIEPAIPEGAFTTTATIRAFIDEHNASLPAQLSADDIKALLEEYNATLPAPIPLNGDKDATGIAYLELPDEFKRIVGDDKNFTATAMKSCIKEYNATLPAPMKTSGSRDALLEQLAVINPDLVAQEAQKPAQLKVSGTKADLIQAVKSVNPDAVFVDELVDAWRENPEGKVLVTRPQLSTALAIQKALLNHPTAGKLLTHPSRAVEVSYFGFDDETGLEVRVRPDLEIDLDGVRIGADLKTISMWNIKQEGLRGRLHREIIDRDYHLSAAMYSETAALDQFFWIFVNKDENYHWIAIIEASSELLELGMLEYRKAMRAIANGFDTGVWPAPITEDYTEELNDFDLRRLEALRLA
ncbi:RecE family exodeoxyribonuclease [Edwardsiella piscicida]|uniref:RecE family exodeoxyribonuclease n=1 Tax=Edwardsiella piscicida TaxID=1263550 RepID=UPI00370D8A2B